MTPGSTDRSDSGARLLEAAEDFWRFSGETYARADVAPSALALQDEDGADVNILLLCLWWARRTGTSLDAPTLARLAQAVAPWSRTVLAPLRASRTVLKTWPELDQMTGDAVAALRKDILAAELEAERIQQRLLLQTLEPLPARSASRTAWTGAAREAVYRYCAEQLVPAGDTLNPRETRLQRFLNAVAV